MKSINSIIALSLLISFSMVSCNQGQKEKKSEQSAEKKSEKEHEEHESHSPEGLQLQENGDKWVSDEYTHKAMGIMRDTLKAFEEKQETDASSYQKLGMELERQMKDIFSNCTMKGKAHDELHKVLLPIHKSLDNLKNAKDTEKAGQSFEKISKQVHLYFEHFENT